MSIAHNILLASIVSAALFLAACGGNPLSDEPETIKPEPFQLPDYYVGPYLWGEELQGVYIKLGHLAARGDIRSEEDGLGHTLVQIEFVEVDGKLTDSYLRIKQRHSLTAEYSYVEAPLILLHMRFSLRSHSIAELRVATEETSDSTYPSTYYILQGREEVLKELAQTICNLDKLIAGENGRTSSRYCGI